jgi:hypothetical protein
MAHRFSYVNQTVEHCLRVPTPDNVRLIKRYENSTVYTIDLPASVWAMVVVDNEDPSINKIVKYESASLREEAMNKEYNYFFPHQAGHSSVPSR